MSTEFLNSFCNQTNESYLKAHVPTLQDRYGIVKLKVVTFFVTPKHPFLVKNP